MCVCMCACVHVCMCACVCVCASDTTSNGANGNRSRSRHSAACCCATRRSKLARLSRLLLWTQAAVEVRARAVLVERRTECLLAVRIPSAAFRRRVEPSWVGNTTIFASGGRKGG